MLMQDEMAGLGRRLLAVVIDMLMLKLLDLPLSRTLREVTPSPIAALVLEYGITLIYCTIFLARRGQTPGKIMTSLRVISVDGGPLGRARAFVRSAVKWTPFFAILIVLSVLNPYAEPHQVALGAGRVLTPPPEFDAEGLHLWRIVLYSGSLLGLALVWITRRHPDRQALHDRVSGTLVMRVE
ncbi:MAG: RDD family protein [Candidatus Latescibacteria bacterium]|nr:RDD family protein [Candidatus Latescibacterota bacterium]